MDFTLIEGDNDSLQLLINYLTTLNDALSYASVCAI